MTTTTNGQVAETTGAARAKTRWKPIRIWPAVLLLASMVPLRLMPQFLEDPPPWIWLPAVFGPAICGILILLWWLALSRTTWPERLIGFFGVLLIAGGTLASLDKTMLGPAVPVITIPVGTAAFAVGAILASRMLSFKRTLIALLFAGFGFGFSAAVRTEGVWGNFLPSLQWRWNVSPEVALLENESSRGTTDRKITNTSVVFARPEWPGFRGLERDGRQHGPKIALDWEANPPKLIWKISVGPGWSSFAVAGNWIFTQEQRGPLETVVCYEADSGLEIWKRQVESRFDDSLGGPGPRATPTLADGALFVTFATGIVMRLDPATGNVVWQQNMRKVADRKPPPFGFAASPLVVKSVVIVHAGGAGDKGILAFDKETGKLEWSAASGDHSYSSPQLSTILDEQLVLMLTNAGLNILDPVTGAERLNYEWGYVGYRSVQPQVLNSDSILIPTGTGAGTRRIRVSNTAGQLAAKEQWTSRQFRPDFNDFVVHDGHAYGFDGSVFTSINLENGRINWTGGRYGKGQVLLLEDSGALLLLGEQGEVVLLKADPAALIELATFQAIEGKTWNHPVVVGDRLYVRNSREAACYRLPLANAASNVGGSEASK